MRISRFYQPGPLPINSLVTLNEDVFGHVIKVLRLKDGDEVILFNGELHNEHYFECGATLQNVSKKSAQALIHTQTQKFNESPLNIHLGQGISRGDRMDFTLQKSVELGVNTITPLFTERCGVKLTGERLQKKQEQWQKIVNAACEQSGRCFVPIIKPAITLEEWLAQETTSLKLNLHPKAEHSIMNIPAVNNRVRLLIGPEGGLSDNEIQLANDASFDDVLLGPRVLRTETAALTAITALQCRFGDLN